jgi:hypothetical protein
MGARLSALRDPVTLAVGALAVHRLTRLITEDTLTGPLRVRVARWGGSTVADPSTAETFIHCPWCVGVWVAAGWATLTVAAPAVAAPAGAALAWSSAAGLLSSLE